MVDTRDDRWAFINPGNTTQSLAIIQDILRDFEERLAAIDVNGSGLVIPSDFITQAMLAADSVGTSEIQANAVGTSEIATDAVTAAKLAADVAGLGLSQAAGGELDVNVDGVTLEVVADVLKVKSSGLPGSFPAQAASVVFAGPSSGGSAVPTFRALVVADLPLASVRTATTTPVTVTAAEAAAGATIFTNMAAPGAVAVNLPAGVTGYRVTVKDARGDATANNVTTTPAAGTIDGAATDVINTNYGARTYVYNGTEWGNV